MCYRAAPTALWRASGLAAWRRKTCEMMPRSSSTTLSLVLLCFTVCIIRGRVSSSSIFGRKQNQPWALADHGQQGGRVTREHGKPQQGLSLRIMITTTNTSLRRVEAITKTWGQDSLAYGKLTFVLPCPAECQNNRNRKRRVCVGGHCKKCCAKCPFDTKIATCKWLTVPHQEYPPIKREVVLWFSEYLAMKSDG